MAASQSVYVSVEAICESQIQEVTLDGQEIYTEPLSMSENLSKLTHKIDFTEDANSKTETSEAEADANTEKEQAKFQPSLWPWDSVRNKLKSALTEVSVLGDVLGVARQKRYMVLDPVQADTTEQKPAIMMLSKKKCLQSAATILVDGAERLKKSQIEKSTNQIKPDFHQELMKLRQSWRLKKVGNTILGDLSYKSVGSRHWQSGTFEVKKQEDESLPNSLQVIIPTELEGVAHIQVSLHTSTDVNEICAAQINLPSTIRSQDGASVSWQEKLRAAQNVIFCKELFSQLAREAVSVKTPIPNIVVGNKIICTLFPGVQLCIALCHSSQKDKTIPVPHVDNRHVLEHSLHQLLRETFFLNINHSMPHPVTATLGVTKRRRLAGPQAATTQDLLDMIETETLLERIIKQAQHSELRISTMNTIDHLAQTIPDPQITAHWNFWSDSLETAVRINITSFGYENTYRTVLSLRVGTDTVKVTGRDGKVINLSYEQQELKDLFMSQLSQHQISVVQYVAKLVGWQVLSVSPCTGIGDMEKCASTSALLLASPNGDVLMGIKSGPSSGQKVLIQTVNDSQRHSRDIVTDSKWSIIDSDFHEIDIERIEGKTFVDRVELVMASYGKTSS